MGRTGITYFDVANAIATIQGKQKNPTVDSIREELKTGSRNTIAKHLSDWKKQNGIKNTTDTGIPIELQNLIQSLWGKIQSDADHKIERHQIEANEEISVSKNQLAQTRQQNSLLHTEINELTEKLKLQTNISHELTTRIHQYENEKTKYDERINSLETQGSNQKTENERLHQLLKNTQDNLTHYQQAIEKQRSEQHMQLEKERAEHTLKLNILEKQISKISEEKSVIETKYQLLIDESHSQKNNIEKMNQQNSQLQLKNSELTIQNNHFNMQNEKLRNEIMIATSSLKENEKLNHETLIQLAVLKNENISISKNRESCEEKINQLQSSINQLSQENSSLKLAMEATT